MSSRRDPILSALPPQLEHPFRLIAFDWDGTAVASRQADATRVVSRLDRLLALGVRVAIVTGTNLNNVARQLGGGIDVRNAQRLTIATNRGSELFGFDRRGEPVVLWQRVATAEEIAQLDRAAALVKEHLERVTGLTIAVIGDRLNRRKIDVIPEPAWHDPPKSAIGELLAAVEARLRSAGLRQGLREAVELTEWIAAEVGLVGAKVTSDVKHIEIGLTDKADAMSVLFREIAQPLGIHPGDVLIAGDEFGPIAGFEGSDHKMLAIPEVVGATILSVGPEPGGAPAGVLHVGGGPDRFAEVLERQLLLDEELGPFAPPRDAAWLVDEPGFDLAREHEIESLLSIANGYVGSRGSLAEGSSVSRPATFLAGAFEPSNDVSPVPELVILPDWGRLRVSVEGETLGVERGPMRGHRRTLDMRRGRLYREGIGAVPAGHELRLRTFQLASLAERHVLLEGLQLEPQNFTGTVRVDAILSGDVRSASGAAHWAGFEASGGEVTAESAGGPSLVGRTRGGLVAAMTSSMRVTPPAEGGERATGPSWARERCALPARLGDKAEIFRSVAVYTSRDGAADPIATARSVDAALAARPIEDLIERHDRAWTERWRRADVEIAGAPKLERALRFAAYHLLAAVNPDDPRCSIGARSLSGEAYRGHVFWDTEAFMLPFFVFAYPEAARTLLAYRHRTLDGARRKAKALGYEGALYAWESADTGEETTPDTLLTPFGELIEVLSGRQEHHISADVAWAVWLYARITGDRAFVADQGLEVLLETARFWASRGVLGEGGAYHIEHVIGPDEYHEGVDDNAFTNWLARFNLLEAAAALEAAGPAARARLGALADEIPRFRECAARMTLALDPATGLIEQFRGFHALEYVDLREYGSRHAPMDVILGRARTQAAQVVKQADVVQLVAMLWDEVPPAARRANFLHYEPRTAHGSSLSPGIHALVAARLGLAPLAEKYLDPTADIDLGNTMGNAAGGVHAAALGSLWQAVVFGVAGVRPAPHDPEALAFEPNLLPTWRHVAFPLSYRGCELDVVVEPRGIEIHVEGAVRVRVEARGSFGSVVVGALEPGKRYAALRTGDGYGDWEEIR